MKNIYPKTNQSQHDSVHNTPSPQVGPQTTHTATPLNYQTIKIIFQALGFGISSFILLTMFAIFISNPVEAATEIPQVSINLDEVDSGQLLLRSENVISSAILLTTDVKVTVSGTVSRTTVSQRFINTGATWAEGVYAFPVGETAAVDSLKMRIGDSFIEGQIKEKKAAKIAYKTAKREGKKAFQAMVSKCMENKYSEAEDIDLLVEEKIFAGFYSYQDKELLQKFQTSNWTERLALLGKVQDERIQQLGRRLVAFNARHLLDDKYQNVVQEYLADKWSAGEADVRWATIASVHAQLSELEKERFVESLLEEMRTFYRNRIKAQGCSVNF